MGDPAGAAQAINNDPRGLGRVLGEAAMTAALAKAGKSSPVKEACSFPADTPVRTPTGHTPIAALDVGDQVLAWDATTGQTGAFTVTARWGHLDPMVVQLTIGGEQLTTTPEHPFFVPGTGWVAAGDLWVGADVRRAHGHSGPVQTVALEQRPQLMYNLTVATAHTYFVGEEQWLVHNQCALPLRPTPPNPHGRHGSPQHQARIAQAEQQLTSSGWTTVSGGSLPEQAIAIPGTGRVRYPDLVMSNTNGDKIAVQVGRVTAGGRPVWRERRALADLRSTGAFRHVFFLRY